MLGISLETGSLNTGRHADRMEALVTSPGLARWFDYLFFVPPSNPYPTHE
jgi:hypothetical protein